MASTSNRKINTQVTPPRRVRRKQLEALYGIRERTWAKWAVLGKGPSYVLAGGIALYDLTECEAWLNAQPRRGGGVLAASSGVTKENRRGHNAA